MCAAWAAKEALWLRKLLATLTGDVGGAVEIFCDNQGALAVMRIPCSHQRAKHIDVQHHFFRERVARGEVSVAYCPTDAQHADVSRRLCRVPSMMCAVRGLVWLVE